MMNTTANATLKQRLSTERLRRHWSQLEVADHIGTTPGNVSRWERGITSPGPYFRTKLCALFGMSAHELGLAWEALDDLPSQDPPASAVTASLPWKVNSQENSFLTSRDELLVHLHTLLRTPTTAALTQAISGLEGISRMEGVHSLLIAFEQQGKPAGQVEITTGGAGTVRMTVLLVEHSIEGILPSKRNCNDAYKETEHALSERTPLMNTDIQAEKQLEMGSQAQASLTETDMLVQCGLSAEEIVAMRWLRHWYQTGGSDRVQIVRRWEFLKWLLMMGMLEV